MEILKSFENDGYIYCLLTPLNYMDSKLVKIGKIEMKRNDTEKQVLNKLLRRYSTYYDDMYTVLHFIRVGDCHEAEKRLFKKLSSIKYNRELYFYDLKKISNEFENTSKIYPNIQILLSDNNIETLTKLNSNRRR